ncbi:MAG: MATE family efflux transporter [Bacteroidales bacterium]|nr:MATE family efflux transporter [Bacteroidales bacterium]
MSNFFRDIIESLKGIEQDYTSMKLRRAIVLLAIPMVIEMIMESLFALADIYFVSQLGAEATATVGITESLMTIIYSIGMGLAMATTGLVSRRIGEKHEKDAANTAVQAIILGIVLSIPFFIAGTFYSKQILNLMGSSDGVINDGNKYSAILIGSNAIIMLLFINNAIFRSAGDAMVPMIVMIVANLINIVLDPCLIFGWGPFPEMGLTGAAVATCIGRSIGVIMQIFMLTRKHRRIYINLKSVILDLKIILKLLGLSAGGIGQFLISTTSWVFLYRIMTEFGDHVVAGYTIAIRLLIFSLLPAWGLSNAASTLVGQNLGAKHPERAERSAWMISYVNMAFLSVVGIVFYAGSGYFVPLFTSDPLIIEIGIECLKILSFGYLFYGLGMVMSQSFNGAGDTFTPTIINFICFWLIEIPLAYLLALYLNMGAKGVFLSVVIAESLLGLFAFLIFKRGKWKLREI